MAEVRLPQWFTDPKTGATYEWLVNHNEEDEVSKTRNIEHTANTANTGLVRQQGNAEPTTFRYQGHILHRSQLIQFWKWFERCEHRTIYFTDFTGDAYEVLITRFAPKRVRTSRNPRDFVNAGYWYWQYAIEMEVVKVIGGTMEDVSP